MLTNDIPQTKCKPLNSKQRLPNPPKTGVHTNKQGDPLYVPSEASQSTTGQYSEDESIDLASNDSV